MPSRVAILACLLLLFASAPASAGIRDSARLWATLNVCDTPDHPDELGIRGSMPGLAKRSVLWMRLRAQYWSYEDERWRHFVGRDAERTDSGWRRLGRQRGGSVQSGWVVRFAAPALGDRYKLRGVARFRWRRAGRTVRRARALTEAGHPGTLGADPPSHSAATCLIT